jgi:S1-C subfamily serine protease
MPTDTAATAPAFVYLSGRRRGRTVWPEGDYLRLGTSAEAEIQLAGVAGEVPPEDYGILRRVDEAFELDVAPGKRILVNGDPVDRRVLASGDVLEIGEAGPALRFRLYPATVTGKPLHDVIEDALESGRRSTRGRLRRLAFLARRVPAEMLTETTAAVRWMARASALLIVAALAVFGWAGIRLAVGEGDRVTGLADLLARQGDNPATAGDVARVLGELQSEVTETARRVRALEGQSAAVRLVISAATRSTAFLQGAWGFVDPRTGRPLRIVVGPDGAPVRGPGGEPLVTTDERAPVIEALFTGTAFVVAEDGLFLTNRHIAQPWSVDDAARRVAEQGWIPVMRRLIAYVPGAPDSVPLQLVAVSDSADLAAFRAVGSVRRLPSLPLAESAARPGDEVIVLGYPLGMRALMARADARFLADLRAQGDVDFWSLGAQLARTGQISPLASRGIVGQVSREAVVYDAETTSGGSGGPVLSVKGEVLAVTSAILPEFGGSNLGVPVIRARGLLARVTPP